MASRKQFPRGDAVTHILNDWIEQNDEYSLIEMAERIGVTKSANCFMSQVRSGRSKMPISKVTSLAKLLDQDPRPMVVAILDQYYPELRDALIKSKLIDEGVEELINLRDLAPSNQKEVI